MGKAPDNPENKYSASHVYFFYYFAVLSIFNGIVDNFYLGIYEFQKLYFSFYTIFFFRLYYFRRQLNRSMEQSGDLYMKRKPENR